MATVLGDGVVQLHCRGVNAYLLDDGAPTLIDAGAPWDLRRLRAELLDAGYHPGDVERVLLTHYDIDHVGALSRLSPALDATVYASDPDRAYLAGLRSPPTSTRKELIQRLFGPLIARPSLPVRPLSSGDEFGSIVARRAPGHTPGHTVFVSEELSTVVFGDAVREHRGSLRPMYDLLCHSPSRARETILDLAAELPVFDIACVGHGTPLPADGYRALETLADRM